MFAGKFLSKSIFTLQRQEFVVCQMEYPRHSDKGQAVDIYLFIFSLFYMIWYGDQFVPGATQWASTHIT